MEKDILNINFTLMFSDTSAVNNNNFSEIFFKLINSNDKMSSNQTDSLLMEPWEYNVAAFILFLIGFFGFILNLFVIIIICKDSNLRTPMNIILFNVVCCDFLVSIFGNPITLTAALSHKWIFGKIMCISYGFLMALLGITSITTLTVLAYERYLLVQFPLSTHQIGKRGAVIAVLLIWIYSIALTAPPLFGWGAYVNEAANISCSINWETRTSNACTYIIFLFIFGLVVPVIVIVYSYLKIIHAMNKSSRRLGRTNRAEKRITLMVAIMIFAFLFAWTPYATFALIMQFGPENLISTRMAVLPALLAKSSICYNPLIYIGCNTQFRESFKRRGRSKDTTIVETTINQISYTSNDSVTKCSAGKMTFCLKSPNIRNLKSKKKNHSSIKETHCQELKPISSCNYDNKKHVENLQENLESNEFNNIDYANKRNLDISIKDNLNYKIIENNLIKFNQNIIILHKDEQKILLKRSQSYN